VNDHPRVPGSDQPAQPSWGNQPAQPSWGEQASELSSSAVQPLPSDDPSRPQRRIPRWAQLGAVLLVVVVAAVVVLSLVGGAKQVLTVKFQLIDVRGNVTCEDGGSGGYSDISPGMPVTVKDQDGKIIGSSSLPETGEQLENHACEWTMPIEVEDAEQYAVEGGDRGAVTYSHDQLDDKDWTIRIGIG
jgi:hypothetical protein